MSVIREDLKPETVAPLLCGMYNQGISWLSKQLISIAGLTMYGALNKLDKLCKPGDWVVIMGAGGGLGHL